METKPFFYTSEFWTLVAVNLGAVLSALADVIPAEFVPLINAFSGAAYAISRGLAKAGVDPHPKTTVSVPADHSAEVTVRGSAEPGVE